MNDSPFFSIVIPTYNRAGYILNTLRTVFDQTFRDFEVIVVDNASTDNTISLLQPLVAEGKVKLIVHDQNYERARSRNTGQQHARGKFLTFLDSDDFMYPNNLADAAAFAAANPSCRFFHNLYEMVGENKKVVYQYRFKPLGNIYRQIANGNFLSCIGVFIHREIYTSIFWDETPVLVGSEDYDFWIRVLSKYPGLGRIEKINSGILHHPGRTMNQLQLGAAIRRIDYFVSKVEADQFLVATYKDNIRRMKASLYLFLAGLARTGNRASSLSFLTKALRADPTMVVCRDFYANFFLLLSGLFKRSG